MEELREFCESGLPITLSEEWGEFNNAKQLLLENQYQPDPEDPNSFIKVIPSVQQLSSDVEPLQIQFPEGEGRPEYSQVQNGSRNKTPPSSGFSSEPEYKWRSCTRIQFDTGKLRPDLQIFVPARIPSKPPLHRQQSVIVQVKIHPKVRDEGTNLLIHLQPEVLQIGVPRAETFPHRISLGFYPSFARITFYPLFSDPTTVALPEYTHPEGATSGGLSDTRPAGAARRTTGTRLGVQVSGWGIINFSAERSWEVETEEETKQFEKLVPVTVDEDGNAASFEWSILRWSEGNRYNASKPHSGIRFKTPRPPFNGGSSTVLRLQRFPGALWHLDPGLVRLGALKFSVHIEVEMHLVWFLGSSPFFRSPGSDSTAFEWRNEFEVDLNTR